MTDAPMWLAVTIISVVAMTLAYYIAAVNVETTYHALAGKSADTDDYEPFPGIVLADTFQLSEEDCRRHPKLRPW